MTLAELLVAYPRIAVAGGPNAGKTTLANLVQDRTVVRTDDWKELGYSPEVPFLIIDACQAPRFLVEGVQVARALRKGLQVDAVVWMPEPLVELTPEQERQRRGTGTIWDDARRNFLADYVQVLEGRFVGEEPVFQVIGR